MTEKQETEKDTSWKDELSEATREYIDFRHRLQQNLKELKEAERKVNRMFDYDGYYPEHYLIINEIEEELVKCGVSWEIINTMRKQNDQGFDNKVRVSDEQWAEMRKLEQWKLVEQHYYHLRQLREWEKIQIEVREHQTRNHYSYGQQANESRKNLDRISETLSCCPECGGGLDGDGESEADGCAADWAVWNHWWSWCIGGLGLEETECTCDYEERQRAYRNHYRAYQRHYEWERLWSQHPERIWVDESTEDEQGPHGYKWPDHVVKELLKLEPWGTKKYRVPYEHQGGSFGSKNHIGYTVRYPSHSVEHRSDCKKNRSCGWSSSGRSLHSSGGWA